MPETGAASGSDAEGPGAGLVNIGVLLCDHVDPDLKHHVGGDYDVLYTEFLTAAARRCGVTIDVVIYDAVNGVLPMHVDECDAWVVSGSRHDAYGDASWVVDLRRFVGRLIAAVERLVGICFGHQLVAAAAGGAVAPTDRWMLGPQHLTLPSTAWFDEFDGYLHAMHRDVVSVLPEQATVLGAGDTADVAAYMVGDHVFCVQDHPEFPGPYVAGLIEVRSDRIDADVAAAALDAIERQSTDGGQIGDAVVRFLIDARR